MCTLIQFCTIINKQSNKNRGSKGQMCDDSTECLLRCGYTKDHGSLFGIGLYIFLLEGVITGLFLFISPLLDQDVACDHRDDEDIADHTVHDHQFIYKLIKVDLYISPTQPKKPFFFFFS